MNLVIRALLLTELGTWRLDSVSAPWVTADVTNVAVPVPWNTDAQIKDARYYPGQQPALLGFGVAAIGMSLVVASGQKAEIQRAGCLCLLVLLPLLFLELFIVFVSFLFLGGFHNLR